MRYLGGKSRLAKEIAAVIAPKGLWWEPFCGGLSVSVQLAKYGPGIVSDVNPALMALYQAVRDGWEPPTSVSREEYAAARLLPDSDPRKAFIGFGCSFGGKWFGGYASARPGVKGGAKLYAYCDSTRNSLARELPALALCELRRLSFLGVDPGSFLPETIYCDPPYAATTRYAGCAFDSDAFWATCRAWADLGVRVFVSEYSAGTPAVLAWERAHVCKLRGTHVQETRTERLFRILPAAAQAAE